MNAKRARFASRSSVPIALPGQAACTCAGNPVNSPTSDFLILPDTRKISISKLSNQFDHNYSNCFSLSCIYLFESARVTKFLLTFS